MHHTPICLDLVIYDNDNKVEKDLGGNYSREYAILVLKEAIRYLEGN